MNPEIKTSLLPEALTSLWGKIILLVIVVAMLAYLPFWWYFNRHVAFPEGVESVDVVVPAGASGRTIAQLAEKAGIGVSENTFVAALRVQGRPADIHAGRYRFFPGMSLADIVEKFKSAQVESFSLRIPDGVTIWQLRKIVENAGPDLTVTTADFTDAELLRAMGVAETHAEGLFAPETYRFRSGISDLDVYRAAYRAQKNILQKAWEGRDPTVALASPYEALVLASIIEKETSRPEDRAMVSSVFNNRLRIRMPLQTDPSVIYGIGREFNGNLTRRDLRTPGPYNTYLNRGLPPSPIAMPTMASIEAALHPAQSSMLYFVARGDGTTQFSQHLAEHNRAVEKYQKQPARAARNKNR